MQYWKKAENDFVDHFKGYGKRAAVFRLVDTATAKALAGKKAFLPEQPADYMVTFDGQTFYAEVKASTDEDRFHFQNIRKNQLAASRRVAKAGGLYFFFLKSEHLNRWFCVPATTVHAAKDDKRGSLLWTELEPYVYDL